MTIARSRRGRRLARFWAELLGQEVVEDGRGCTAARRGHPARLRLVGGRAEAAGPDRMHLHLTSTDAADQQHVVARALELGAANLDVGQRPEEGHVVVADPEGGAFCVIEPGNRFLAGCGFLGELACDGTGSSACSGARRRAGRWSGTRTRRPRSSRRTAARRSHGAAGRLLRGRGGTSSGSSLRWPPLTCGQRSTGWSPSGRPGSRTAGTAPSCWPIPTGASSASDPVDLPPGTRGGEVATSSGESVCTSRAVGYWSAPGSGGSPRGRRARPGARHQLRRARQGAAGVTVTEVSDVEGHHQGAQEGATNGVVRVRCATASGDGGAVVGDAAQVLPHRSSSLPRCT